LRSQKSIDTIKALARRWNVGFIILGNDGDNKTKDSSDCQVQNEFKPLNPEVTSVTGTNQDPGISAAYEGLGGHFDASYAIEPIGEYIGSDEEHNFDISMVNIPVSADDELFGLSQFFQTFESYPDLL
jgi:secreted protein with Ig-like and vWFA domain